MKQQTKLEQALLQLGNTAEIVAATLKGMNISGVRNTVRYLNPVVRFVQQRLRIDDYRLDLLHGDGIPYTLRMTVPNGGKDEVVLPDAVKQFLDGFNLGAYPDLELPR
jgi:hypothetical protein